MNCQHCNEKLEDFSCYCENCGKKGPSFWKWCAILAKERKKLTITMVTALLLTIGLGIWWGVSTHFDPADYVIAHASGFDGSGTVEFEIDYSALYRKVLGPEPKENSKRNYEKRTVYANNKSKLNNTLRVYADHTTDMTNGRYFTVTVYVDNPEVYELFGVRLKDEKYTKTFKIGKDTESLELPVQADLFEYIGLSFSGTNGNGTMTISDELRASTLTFPSGKKVEITTQCTKMWTEYELAIKFTDSGESVYIDLNVNKDAGLSNDDAITLSFDYSIMDELLENGIDVTINRKTYQVTGLTDQ